MTSTMHPKPCFSYEYINDLLKEHGITRIINWDTMYVIPGNTDDPENGIVHQPLVDAFNEYEKLIADYCIKYEPEVFDCDDFAHLFKTVCSLYRINGIGYAVGKLYDADNQLIGWHAFNIMPYVLDKNTLGTLLLLVEPQLSPPYCFASIHEGKAKLFNLTYEIVYVEI